jgi:hypothetical protein
MRYESRLRMLGLPLLTGHTLAVDGGYLAGGLWSGAPGSPPKA